MTPEQLDYAVWPLFYDMHRRGLLVDEAQMISLRHDVSAMLEEQAALIEVFTGRPINPACSTEVASWLESTFSGGRRTKITKARATDERSLKLYPPHPAIDAILEWRGLAKMRSTFIDPVLDTVGKTPDRAVHPKWKLTRVRSGRVAMEDPNLLAFPSRDALGRRVRSCFVARPGHVMCSVDFSQLEPRIVAALSADKRLLAVYNEGLDLYSDAASSLGVTRTVAKILTLGILYGMGADRLFDSLIQAGCVTPEGLPVYSRTDCEYLIQGWFDTYTGVADLITKVVAEARKCGYAMTVGGRIRQLPALHIPGDGWPAEKMREEAERQAFNHLIQGTGMEVLKHAMIAVNTAYPDAHMLLAIHDEIVFEIQDESIAEELSWAMSSCISGVALPTEFSVGPDWGSLKG